MAHSLWDYVPVNRADIKRLVEKAVEERAEAYIRRYVGSRLAGLEGRISTLTSEHTLLGERINKVEEDQYYLGERMTSMEENAWTRVGELVALIKAEFASLRGQIDAAVADKEAAVAAGVASALADDAAADTERVSGLIGELESVLPAAAPVPEVPVPDPGQPAELPETPAEPIE